MVSELLIGQRVLVVQKVRKRKKLPRRASTLEFLDLWSESSVLGRLRKRLTTAEQTAEKRQTEVIWQSSKKRLSGEASTSLLQRKWLRFQTKLKRKELMTRCEKLIRPYSPRRATSCAIELARLIFKLQKSRYTYSPPMLNWYRRVGSREVGTVPLKSVKKTLNQNFWKMGERMVVNETMKSGVNTETKVFFLKCEKSIPNPMTANTEARISRLPNSVCFCCVVPSPEILFWFSLPYLISLLKPQTQRMPLSVMSTKRPTILFTQGFTSLGLRWGRAGVFGAVAAQNFV